MAVEVGPHPAAHRKAGVIAHVLFPAFPVCRVVRPPVWAGWFEGNAKDVHLLEGPPLFGKLHGTTKLMGGRITHGPGLSSCWNRINREFREGMSLMQCGNPEASLVSCQGCRNMFQNSIIVTKVRKQVISCLACLTSCRETGLPPQQSLSRNRVRTLNILQVSVRWQPGGFYGYMRTLEIGDRKQVRNPGHGRLNEASACANLPWANCFGVPGRSFKLHANWHSLENDFAAFSLCRRGFQLNMLLVRLFQVCTALMRPVALATSGFAL